MTIDDLADQVAWLDQQLSDLKAVTSAPQLAQAILADLELDDQITCLMQAERPAQWCTPEAIRCLAAAWPDARQRLLLATAARKCGVMPAMLAGLVEQWHGETADDRERLTTINGRTLLTTDYARRQDVIPEVLPAGCTLLAGNAKDGKSLLAYHLAACVATGKPFLGQFPVVQGEVLFFALEDGERRGKARLERQREQLGVEPAAFATLHFRFWDAPKLGLGFERFLTQWVETHPETRLIIIDILEKIRPPRSEFADLYRTGYASTAPLTRVAQEQNVALLVVHHTNKNPHSDPRLLVSGPMSVLGGADNAWLLRRPYGETEADLIIAGRDIPEQEWALRFEEGLWSLEGTLGECRMSRERREVLEVLQEERGGMKPYQIALALGKKAASMRSLLRKMREEGQIAVGEEGLYTALVDPPGVHGVHDVSPAPACMPEREACTEDDPPWEEGRCADTVAPQEPGDIESTVHADNAMHGMHTPNAIHTDNGVHTDHVEHADNAEHSMHTDHAMHAMHAVHADHGDHADHGMHAVHAPSDEEDPFLAPEAYPEVPGGILAASPDEEPAHASTPAQTSTSPPEARPLQEGDGIWACLANGTPTNATPWEVVEIQHLKSGVSMVYALNTHGRLTPWRLEHCRRVEDTTHA